MPSVNRPEESEFKPLGKANIGSNKKSIESKPTSEPTRDPTSVAEASLREAFLDKESQKENFNASKAAEELENSLKDLLKKIDGVDDKKLEQALAKWIMAMITERGEAPKTKEELEKRLREAQFPKHLISGVISIIYDPLRFSEETKTGLNLPFIAAQAAKLVLTDWRLFSQPDAILDRANPGYVKRPFEVEGMECLRQFDKVFVSLGFVALASQAISLVLEKRLVESTEKALDSFRKELKDLESGKSASFENWYDEVTIQGDEEISEIFKQIGAAEVLLKKPENMGSAHWLAKPEIKSNVLELYKKSLESNIKEIAIFQENLACQYDMDRILLGTASIGWGSKTTALILATQGMLISRFFVLGGTGVILLPFAVSEASKEYKKLDSLENYAREMHEGAFTLEVGNVITEELSKAEAELPESQKKLSEIDKREGKKENVTKMAGERIALYKEEVLEGKLNEIFTIILPRELGNQLSSEVGDDVKQQFKERGINLDKLQDAGGAPLPVKKFKELNRADVRQAMKKKLDVSNKRVVEKRLDEIFEIISLKKTEDYVSSDLEKDLKQQFLKRGIDLDSLEDASGKKLSVDKYKKFSIPEVRQAMGKQLIENLDPIKVHLKREKESEKKLKEKYEKGFDGLVEISTSMEDLKMNVKNNFNVTIDMEALDECLITKGLSPASIQKYEEIKESEMIRNLLLRQIVGSKQAMNPVTKGAFRTLGALKAKTEKKFTVWGVVKSWSNVISTLGGITYSGLWLGILFGAGGLSIALSWTGIGLVVFSLLILGVGIYMLARNKPNLFKSYVSKNSIKASYYKLRMLRTTFNTLEGEHQEKMRQLKAKSYKLSYKLRRLEEEESKMNQNKSIDEGKRSELLHNLESEKRELYEDAKTVIGCVKTGYLLNLGVTGIHGYEHDTAQAIENAIFTLNSKSSSVDENKETFSDALRGTFMSWGYSEETFNKEIKPLIDEQEDLNSYSFRIELLGKFSDLTFKKSMEREKSAEGFFSSYQTMQEFSRDVQIEQREAAWADYMRMVQLPNEDYQSLLEGFPEHLLDAVEKGEIDQQTRQFLQDNMGIDFSKVPKEKKGREQILKDIKQFFTGDIHLLLKKRDNLLKKRAIA